MAVLHPLLAPFVPSQAEPYDYTRAAHLLNRAGFGGTPAEIVQVMELGPIKAADWLLEFPDVCADEQSQDDVPDLSSIADYPKTFREIQQLYIGKTEEERKEIRGKLQQANREAINATSAWWLRRMGSGPFPLQEKLTLFWHGHFTTSARDERQASLMWQQNELLRRQSAGNFREFVRKISRDPAMLDYLNNSQNKKAKPNENYARELMELFTLGIGNYTERDIKEVARSLTGWAHDGDDFIFRQRDHDTDIKNVFGRSGNFDGDDVIDIILQQNACAKYISGRLFSFFAYDADEPIYASLGNLLRESKWDMRPVLRTILTSKAFYSDQAVGTQIKSPVQLVVGTMRLLGVDMPQQPRMVVNALEQMGQVPLMPPNVKGWPGGRLWINTSTLFVRYNTAVWLAGGSSPVAAAGRRGQVLPERFARLGTRAGTTSSPRPSGDSADAIVDYWLQRLIQRPVESDKRSILIATLSGRPDREENVKKMIQLIVSMPEYQLC